MIEWVRFDEWDLDTKGSYLVSYQRHGCTCYSVVCGRKELINFTNLLKIGYIASINKPVEKTLEEKFGDYFSSRGEMLTKNCQELAAIAKEHYEKEEK